jgi:hypothetical protein
MSLACVGNIFATLVVQVSRGGQQMIVMII